MSQAKADFINECRRDSGLVVLDDRFDPSSEAFVEGFEKSEEGKKLMADKREEGISGLIEHHMEIIRNNQVSLKQDLAHKYPTADATKLTAIHASKGELESMRLVAKYKKKNKDNDAKRADEIKKLMDEIGPFQQ
jgi:hypothetical protein